MNQPWEKDLRAYYDQFTVGHEQRRQQFLASLPAAVATGSEDAGVAPATRRVGWFYRAATAIAAVLVVGFGLSVLFDGQGPALLNPQAAWAEAIQETQNVRSVHFKISTAGSGLEMWYRQNGDFRMAFSNGIVITSNSEQKCTFDEKSNTLTLRPAGSTGIEWFALGELGPVFAQKQGLSQGLSQGLLRDSRFIASEKVVYKGEDCLKMLYEVKSRKGLFYEYVVDQREPFVYEATIFKESQRARPEQHIEVLDVDEDMAESLFVIAPSEGVRVIDQR